MKKLVMIASVIILLVVGGIFAIHSRKEDTNITKNQTKVGFLLNGKIDDGSWGQSHYESMEISGKELNLDIEYCEDVPMDEGCIPIMEDLIEKGCKIIICNSFEYGDYELKVASEHPDVFFFHATGIKESANLSTYFGRIYQMRYLCGVVAGLQTETNEIGYVAAFDISEVNRGINAFTLGVKSVNPDAKVYVRFSNSWMDDALTRDAAKTLFDAHNIDVVTVHTDSLEVYNEAVERDIWIVGYNKDNAERYPDHFLTAAIWRWENFYTPRIREVLQDKFVSQHYWEGVETGMVDIAPLTENVKDGIKEQVDEQMKRLTDGTYDVFYGPIYDVDGNLKVAQGESMTDDTMLNAFDWYVEGVVIDE